MLLACEDRQQTVRGCNSGSSAAAVAGIMLHVLPQCVTLVQTPAESYTCSRRSLVLLVLGLLVLGWLGGDGRKGQGSECAKPWPGAVTSQQGLCGLGFTAVVCGTCGCGGDFGTSVAARRLIV